MNCFGAIFGVEFSAVMPSPLHYNGRLVDEQFIMVTYHFLPLKRHFTAATTKCIMGQVAAVAVVVVVVGILSFTRASN